MAHGDERQSHTQKPNQTLPKRGRSCREVVNRSEYLSECATFFWAPVHARMCVVRLLIRAWPRVRVRVRICLRACMCVCVCVCV